MANQLEVHLLDMFFEGVAVAEHDSEHGDVDLRRAWLCSGER